MAISRRAAAILGAMLITLTALSSCGTPAADSSAAALATYLNGPLSFSYPSNWRPQPYMNISNFTDVITYLSTDRLNDPCTRTTAPGGVTTTCGWPLRQLSPGGVLVIWSQGNAIDWQIDREPGQARTIAGRPAKLAVNKPGACRQVGGEETVTATMATGGSSYYELVACLRTPNQTLGEQQVRALIDSTQIKTSGTE
jgi:hypothetical protein